MSYHGAHLDTEKASKAQLKKDLFSCFGTAPLPENQQKTLGVNEKDILRGFEANHSRFS